MSQTPQDAAPKGGGSRRSASAGTAPDATPVTAARVAEYLRDHPDFLCEHPELLDVLTPPGQNNGEGVTDLQQFMVQRLRKDLAELTDARDALVLTGRSNLSAQARVHKAILALMKARSFEHFIETLTTDLAVILGLDLVVVGVEQAANGTNSAAAAGVVPLGVRMVDHLIGPGQNLVLRDNATGDPAIFGPGAGLVRSEALIRLSFGGTTPAALLAFGSRDADHFQPGQGTELLNFLARVIETSIRGWLNLPE